MLERHASCDCARMHAIVQTRERPESQLGEDGGPPMLTAVVGLVQNVLTGREGGVRNGVVGLTDFLGDP